MFSNNKIKLSKVLQQNMTEGIQEFPILSSKYYENNIILVASIALLIVLKTMKLAQSMIFVTVKVSNK